MEETSKNYYQQAEQHASSANAHAVEAREWMQKEKQRIMPLKWQTLFCSSFSPCFLEFLFMVILNTIIVSSSIKRNTPTRRNNKKSVLLILIFNVVVILPEREKKVNLSRPI